MRKIALGLVAVVGFSAYAPAANASWLTHLFSGHREPVCAVPAYGHHGGYPNGGYHHDSGYRPHAPVYAGRPAGYIVVPRSASYRPYNGGGFSY